MKKILVALVCMLLFTANYGQNKTKFKEHFDDAVEQQEHGNLTLRFLNAMTGDPIVNAQVTVEGYEMQMTDAEGLIRFPEQEQDGFINVTFECEGYISTLVKAEIVAGTIFFNRVSISPVMDLTKVRIVLDWDQTPGDLDAHFIKDNVYHISYRNTRVLSDGSGQLDRDDMDGYGPETITVDKADLEGVYGYFVHDFSDRAATGSTGMSDSKATVKVYGDGKLLHSFEVPRGAQGNVWYVFNIERGQVVPVNKVSDSQ